MVNTIFAGLFIVIGIIEARAGITLPLHKVLVDEKGNTIKDNEKKLSQEEMTLSKQEKNILIFQKIYFIFMGIFTAILGVLSIVKENFIPKYMVVILAILPIILNKSIGTVISKKIK
ncbi:hypothetical protein SAMN02745248_02233 [Hathewaya proteolytica DSM 3090]|uniref:SdpI/YhfL protein family protein n=1 Tax=Hathewaya proteolytica DSM 3090 TaxID=1121331 RepID=A0A1M6RAA9_9CLOT|nr:hypothetical protein [Hathewaya proteolytica]SHK29413.1 hypothetical protein SAMN02745248_02233 [Hathewaya proteolytica DSM 3090]